MWLPPAPAPTELSGLPAWSPPELTLAGDLRYIVVDELHAGVAGLVVSPWPRLDTRGRPVFGASENDSVRVAAPADALQALLAAERTPVVAGGLDDVQREALVAREVAIGDVFAACVRGQPANGDPAAWLRPPVLDITAPARELAKAQTSAALSGAMGVEYLERVAEEFVAGD